MPVKAEPRWSALLASPWRGAVRPAAATDIPEPRRSLALALKIAADEAVLKLTWLRPGVPGRRDRVRIAAEVEVARELFEARGWLRNPGTYHATPPPLCAPELRPARARGLAYDHLVFDSGYEPHFGEPGRARWLSYDANHTAHAWVLRHPGRSRPWLVCIHGYRMGSPMVDLTGFRADWLHQRLGLNVLLPVLPLHGPRTIGGRSGDGFLSGDVLNAVHAEAHAMWDLRRLLGWVRAQEAPAIGVYGLSLGGYTAALLAALDGELACVIAGIPATDFARLARHHAPGLLAGLAREAGVQLADLEPVLRVVSPLVLPPRVPHERRYLFAGLADRLVPADQVRDLWDHWGRPRLEWYEGSHLSFAWERPVQRLLREALRDSGLAGA